VKIVDQLNHENKRQYITYSSYANTYNKSFRIH